MNHADYSDLLAKGRARVAERTASARAPALVRPSVEPIILPRADKPIPALHWGVANRVILTAGSTVHFPRIEAERIFEPLYIIKLSDASALKLVPSGYGGDRKTVPLVNGAADLSITLTGLYVAMTDGQNWFMTGGPP